MAFKGTKIGVVVRFRPMLSREITSGHSAFRFRWDSTNNSVIVQSTDLKSEKRYNFDQVFEGYVD